MARLLCLRFDVDSIRCVEEGIPGLRRVADEMGVRFTFFVNMGRSFNWFHNLRHLLPGAGKGSAKDVEGEPRDPTLPTMQKLGVTGVLRTVLTNPLLGERYRGAFETLHGEGHELGLHGGLDHVVWQRSLHRLDEDELDALFRPAYERFRERFGRPGGFASPGFVHDDKVSRLLSRYRIGYASDAEGETPFPAPRPGGGTWDYWQVPVNVAAGGRAPIIESGLAQGWTDEEIVGRAAEAIRTRDFAVLYGHPYVEGVRADLVQRILESVEGDYEVVTMAEYLRRWRERHDG